MINQHENSSRHDKAGNVIETHEQVGDLKEAWSLNPAGTWNAKP
jgi:hypothetical protein